MVDYYTDNNLSAPCNNKVCKFRDFQCLNEIDQLNQPIEIISTTNDKLIHNNNVQKGYWLNLCIQCVVGDSPHTSIFNTWLSIEHYGDCANALVIDDALAIPFPVRYNSKSTETIVGSYKQIFKDKLNFVIGDSCSIWYTTCSLKNSNDCSTDIATQSNISIGSRAQNFALSVSKNIDRGFYQTFCFSCTIQPKWGQLPSTFTKDNMSILYCIDNSPIVRVGPSSPSRELEVDVSLVGPSLIHNIDIVQFFDMQIEDLELCHMYVFEIIDLTGSIPFSPEVTVDVNQIAVKFSKQKFQFMTFKIKATAYENEVNTAFSILVDCITVNKITSTYIASKEQYPSVFPYSDPQVVQQPQNGEIVPVIQEANPGWIFKIVLPKTIIQQQEAYELNNIIDWQVDHPSVMCKLQKITLSGPNIYVSLEENPTFQINMGDQANPKMSIATQEPFNYRVMITAEMLNSNPPISQIDYGLLIVCGQEKLSNKKLNFDIQAYVNDPVMKLKFKDFFEVKSLESDVLPEDCPIKEYFVCIDEQCDSISQDTRFKLKQPIQDQNTQLFVSDNSYLDIDFFFPLDHKMFYLKAITTGDISSIFPFLINVCGYEEINLKREKIYSILLQDGPEELINLEELFESNEPDCPVTSYILDPLETDSSMLLYTKALSQLKIFPITLGVFEFNVKAFTQSKVENKIKFTLTIQSQDELDQSEFIIKENNAPIFKVSPILQHTVDIEINNSGKMVDQTDYTYTSEKATDDEEHTFELVVDGIKDTINFVEINMADSKMNLVVHRAMITEKSEKEINFSITLKDEKNKESEKYLFKITINYKGQTQVPKFIPTYKVEQEIGKSLTNKVNSQLKQKSVNDQVSEILLKPFRPASEMTEEELENETFLDDEFVNVTMKEEGLFEDKDQLLLKLREQAIKKGLNAEKNRRLRLKRFNRYRLGYSFPNLDQKFIEKTLRENILIKRKGLELPKTKAPKLLIKSIQSNGTIPFKFNQKMLSPLKEIDQKLYGYLFKVQIKSLLDLSVYTGVFGQKLNNSTRLLQNQEEGDDTYMLSEAERMKFYPEVNNHNEDSFSIDLIFENPKTIEIGGKATIIIEILDPTIFKSSLNFDELTKDSFENGITTFEYQLPPIVANAELSSKYQQNAEDAGDFLRKLQGGNFVVQLLLRGSSQVFYGTIRALQIISYSGLVDVNLPYNTFIFLQATIAFAQMDVFQSEEYYEAVFKFKETQALSQKYEFNGIEDMNFINNSGSYLTMLIILFFTTMLLFLLNKLSTWCFKFKISRSVGIWAYVKCYYDELEQQCCKLILESYFDIAICTFINVLAFIQNNEFYLFFITIDDAMCSIVVIIHSFLIFLLPFFSHYLIYTNFGKEYDFSEERSPWLPIIQEDLREDDYYAQLCTVYFIYRRLLTSIILVFLVSYPMFQQLFLMLFSSANFMYLVIKHPYDKKVNNKTEIFNEYCVLMCSHTFTNLLDSSIQAKSAEYAGWSFIIFAAINVFVNIGFNIYQSLIKSILSAYNFYYDTKIKNLINERIKRRQYLIDQLPDEFCQFNMELKCFKRYQFCKSFYPQLVWLKENLLDFQDLQEYKYYRFAVRGHQYKQAMESVAFKQCIRQVAIQRRGMIKKQKMQEDQDNVHRKIKRTLTSLKIQEKLNSKMFKTSMLNAIVEESEDVISYENELKQIIKDITDKIDVSGIKHLDYFFNYSFNRAYEQLYTYKIQQQMEKDLKFKSYIEIERSKYDDFGRPIYKLELENRLFTNLMNLNFMGFDKIQKHINNKVLSEISKSKEQKLKEIDEKDAIMTFKNTYKNGSLSSVIQCLFNIPEFKKFFIVETYNSQIGGQYSQDKKICEHLNQLFLSFYNDLRINKKNQINLRPLSQLISKLMTSEEPDHFNPEIFLITIIHGINLETLPKQLMADMGNEGRSDKIVKDYYFKGEMNQLFRVLMKTKQMCILGHTQSKLCTSIGLKFKPKCKDRRFSKLIQDHFQPYLAKFKCKECKEKHCHVGIEQNFIQTLPQYLIIYFDSYQENLKLKYPAYRIPNYFDIGNLFKKQGLEVPDQSCFKLQSTIAAPGERKLEKVNFTAFIHQKVNKLEKETRFEQHQNVIKRQLENIDMQNQKNNIWLKFDQDKVQEMLGKDVRTRYSTYLAIYKRIDVQINYQDDEQLAEGTIKLM